MRRRPPGEPTALSSQMLHPSLQRVLQSLDVQLEEELARYRRGRSRKVAARKAKLPAAGQQPVLVPPPPPPRRGMSFRASQAGVTPPLPAMPDLWAESVAEALVPTATNQAAVHSRTEDEFQESSDQLLHGVATPALETPEPSEPGMLASLLTPLGIGSMLLLLLSSVTFGYLLMNPASLRFLGGSTASNPANSGVASSSQTSGQSTRLPTAPNLANQEFVDLNLDTLSNLPASPAAGRTPSPVAVPSSPARAAAPSLSGAVAPGSTAMTPAAPIGAIPPRPVESAPSRAAAADREPAPSRAAAANRETAQPSARRARRRSASSNQARVDRTPVQTQPAAGRTPAEATRSTTIRSTPAAIPSPAASVAAAPRSSGASRSGPYYVVTDYSGDRSLNQARRAVNDAYVRNFSSGAKVQMGVFSESQRAEALIQDLQRQGIPARVLREGN